MRYNKLFYYKVNNKIITKYLFQLKLLIQKYLLYSHIYKMTFISCKLSYNR